MLIGFGDIEIKLGRNIEKVESAYNVSSELFNAIINLRIFLEQLLFFKEDELTKEEVALGNKILAHLKDAEPLVEIFKYIFGALLGTERIPGRRGRRGKATLRIKEFSCFIKAFKLIDILEELQKAEKALWEASDTLLSHEIRGQLDNIVNQMRALLKASNKLLNEALEQIKEKCKCDKIVEL